jgi:hypothetical protein
MPASDIAYEIDAYYARYITFVVIHSMVYHQTAVPDMAAGGTVASDITDANHLNGCSINVWQY